MLGLTSDELFLMTIILMVIGIILVLMRVMKGAIYVLAVAILCIGLAIITNGHPKDGYTADQLEHHFMVLDIMDIKQDSHHWDNCPASWEDFQNWKKNH